MRPWPTGGRTPWASPPPPPSGSPRSPSPRGSRGRTRASRSSSAACTRRCSRREVLREGVVDFAVHGEGERTAVELLAAIAGADSLDRIPGIAFLDGGRTRVNGARALVANLDDLPPAAYDLLPLGRYSTPFSAKRNVISMVTSRGCPYRCTFCDAFVVHGRKYRAHSAERVVEEIRGLADRYAIREVVFKDSEFTLERARVERLCDLLLGGGPRITWTCSARVNCVDGPLLRKMAAAGCRVIQFGVESADPVVLDALKKRITIEKVREAFRAARAAGIGTVANLMVGHTERDPWLDRGDPPPRQGDSSRSPQCPGAGGVPGHRPAPDPARAQPGGRPGGTGGGEETPAILLPPTGPDPRRVFSLDPQHWRENAAAAAQMIGIGRLGAPASLRGSISTETTRTPSSRPSADRPRSLMRNAFVLRHTILFAAEPAVSPKGTRTRCAPSAPVETRHGDAVQAHLDPRRAPPGEAARCRGSARSPRRAGTPSSPRARSSGRAWGSPRTSLDSGAWNPCTRNPTSCRRSPTRIEAGAASFPGGRSSATTVRNRAVSGGAGTHHGPRNPRWRRTGSGRTGSRSGSAARASPRDRPVSRAAGTRVVPRRCGARGTGPWSSPRSPRDRPRAAGAARRCRRCTPARSARGDRRSSPG